MSAADESIFHRCANCGVEKGDGNDVNLKKCSACHLVRYCSIECQKKHRSKHKQECKKRVMEVRDEILFRQPESSHLGDCPICFLPLPYDGQSILMTCCNKSLCVGCHFQIYKQEFLEGNYDGKCPFCRKPVTRSDAEEEIRLKGRIEAEDAVAMSELGRRLLDDGDFQSGLKFLKRAAELGDAIAMFELGNAYLDGFDVEKDESKAMRYFENAAIAGHPLARNNVGVNELKKGRLERAVLHFMIACKQGCDEALENVKKGYQLGIFGKEDFALALRGHQAAVDATKSPLREEALSYRAKVESCTNTEED